MGAPPRRRKVLLAGLGVACWIGVALVVWSRLPKSLPWEAKKLYEAIEEADGRRLMHFAFPEEIERNKLTPEKLTVLFRDIVNPRLRSATNRTKAVTQDNGEQAIHGYSWKNRYGKTYEYSADVYATSRGAKTPVLRRVLDAWCTSYFEKYPGAFTPESRIEAILAGYRDDAPRLRSIGIVALSEVDPVSGKVKLLELEGLDRRYEEWLANLRAQGE
jgi:hypothetical protein